MENKNLLLDKKLWKSTGNSEKSKAINNKIGYTNLATS